MALTSTLDNPPPPLGIEEISAPPMACGCERPLEPELDAAGNGCRSGGRGEFIEKYFEAAGELLSRDFAVAMMDWRGQGGSDRPLRNSRKGHVDDFSHFERDLAAFVRSVLEPNCPRPWFGLCHSMGAAVLLGAAEGGRCPFEILVLTSPLIAARRVSHRGPAGFLVGALDAFGLGGAFIPGDNGLRRMVRAIRRKCLDVRRRSVRPNGETRLGSSEPLLFRPDDWLAPCRVPTHETV